MPAAHTTLWFMGVFLFLWGVTLVVRALPPEWYRFAARFVKHRAGTDRMRHGSAGQMAMAGGGVVAMLVGIVCLVLGVSVYEWVHSGEAGGLRAPIWGSGSLAVAVFSVTLLAWALRGARAKGRRCPWCLYDMAGGGMLCPECGFSAEEEGDLFRPRRRMRVAACALALLALSPSLLLVPNYQQWGVRGLVPSTVMIATFEWLPGDWVYWTPQSDGTLHQRYHQERLASWQERWLVRRSARVMVSKRSSAATVVRAAELVGYEVPPAYKARYVERLAELVTDPKQEVRDTAAQFLYIPWALRPGEDEPDLAETIAPFAERLRGRLDDPLPEVALAAAALLVTSGVHVDEALGVVGRYTSPNPPEGRHAPAVVELALLRSKTREAAYALFEHEDPIVRRHAASAVRWWRRSDERTEAVMLRLLEDSAVEVAAPAAYWLVPIREDAVELIVRAAIGRPAADRAVMLQALTVGTIDGRQIVALLEHDDVQVQRTVLELIARLVAMQRHIDPEVFEAVRRRADSPDRDVAEEVEAIMEALELP